MMELMIAARTDPDIAREFIPIVEEYRKIINGIWLDVFKRAGIPDDKAGNFLHFTLYILRGMALLGQLNSHRALRKPVLDAWRAAARTLLR